MTEVSDNPSLLARTWAWFKDFWQVLKPCRFAVLVVLMGLVVLLFVPQGQDVLYRLVEWGDHAWHQELPTVVLFFVAVLIWALSAWYWTRTILTMNSYQTRDSLRRNLPHFLGTLALVGVAAALLKAAWGYAVFDFQDQRPIQRLITLGVVSIVLAALFFWLGGRKRGLPSSVSSELEEGEDPAADSQSALEQIRQLPTSARVLTGLFMALSISLLVLLTIKTVSVAYFLGTVPLLLLSAASWILFGTLLVHLSSAKKVPLVTILLLVAILFSFWNDNHAVRLVPDSQATSELKATTKTISDRQILGQRFRSWHEDKKGEPIFLVAAEGGGIRAAYWTASVLAAIQDENPEFGRHLFAISGVSGGSLGGAVFASLVAESLERGEEALPCGTYVECTRAVLGRDFLSPAVGMLLGPDLVQRFLPFGVGQFDRSLGLERAWEVAWEEETGSRRFAEPFLDLWRGESGLEVPSLILNGTHVETGRRILTSNLVPARTPGETPEFYDAYHMHDILNADLPLSTAAHNSARFTYISPAGSLMTEVDGKMVLRGHVVDGGYFENSGATTVLEVLKVLETLCDLDATGRLGFFGQVALAAGSGNPSCRGDFHVIYIQNDPKSAPDYKVRQFDPTLDAPADTGLTETLSPIRALMRTRSARGSYAVKSLKAAVGSRNFRDFSLCDEITVGGNMEKVPLPLGWQLSDNSQQAMDRQLGQPCTKTIGQDPIPVDNAKTIEEVLALL
ncbi:MAG: hypothetical protein V3W50_06930 [Thermoanaerobaculia bacterium]